MPQLESAEIIIKSNAHIIKLVSEFQILQIVPKYFYLDYDQSPSSNATI